MNAITQIQPSSFFASYQAFVASTAGLYPTGFDTKATPTALSFSSPPERPPTHTCLYVPHLTNNVSPVNKLFASKPKYPSNVRKTFVTIYQKLQSIVDIAADHRANMQDPLEQVPYDVEKRLQDERTTESLLHSAILLSSIRQRPDRIEVPSRLFMEAARLTANKDAKAMLTELAYATHKNNMKVHSSAVSHEDQIRQLKYESRMIATWSFSLFSSQDPMHDTMHDNIRIFAGIRACFASPVYYHRMIAFLERYGTLPTAENGLRIAWAKLAGTYASDELRDTAIGSAIDQMRLAMTSWDSRHFRSEHAVKLSSFISQLEQSAL
ncbi:MAG: hypothetical protein ABH871_02475 [Pseudomonadota bacterium]